MESTAQVLITFARTQHGYRYMALMSDTHAVECRSGAEALSAVLSTGREALFINCPDPRDAPLPPWTRLVHWLGAWRGARRVVVVQPVLAAPATLLS